MVRNANSLHQRLFSLYSSSSSVDDPSSAPAPADRIHNAPKLRDFLNQQSTNSPAESIDTFSKEVQLFAIAREQTTSIAAAKRARLNIPPTSVEAERLFSAAGLFFTNIDKYFKFYLLFFILFVKFDCLLIIMIL